MSPTTRPLRPRRAAAVILVALSLTGISACSISVGGGSTDQGTAAAVGQEGSPSEQPAASSPSTTATTASQAPRSQAAAPSTQEQASPAAVGSQPASGQRPGARATITDSDWLSDLEFVEQTISASPTMLLNKSGDDVRIEGEVNSLSVTANNTKVFADYVGLLTISGNNVTVYVKDVDRVVIKGTNAEVVWAGNSPKLEDFGHNTETRQQGSEG